MILTNKTQKICLTNSFDFHHLSNKGRVIIVEYYGIIISRYGKYMSVKKSEKQGIES